MAITGGIKFFENVKNLYKDGTTITASTNNPAAKYILDYNKYTMWESIGSSDTVTETIEVTLNGSKDIDRIFLNRINLKDFSIQYWNGSSYSNFTNVVGIDGSVAGGIIETDYSRNAAYYEFDSVSTTKLKITMLKTQVADQEKEITAFLATEEIGTFEGFPRVSKIKHDRNIRATRALSGKRVIQKSYEVTSFKIKFKTYPLQDDIDIVNDLHEREDSFLVWLCGGRVGTQYFKYENRGYRLEDLYHMQVDRPLTTDYAKGIYVNGVDTDISFIEVV